MFIVCKLEEVAVKLLSACMTIWVPLAMASAFLDWISSPSFSSLSLSFSALSLSFSATAAAAAPVIAAVAVCGASEGAPAGGS